jgi:argininosuccinate lyase
MKLWGSRFEGQASPTAEAFGASIGFDQRLWRYDLMGSAAHCRMLAQQDILSQDDAERILRGLRQVAEELQAGQLDLSPAWEDIHTRVEARLVELVGDPGRRLHTARSRNDQVATDLRMFAREAILAQVEAVIVLQEALLGLAERNLDAIMPGYTHLRRAQPVLLAHYLLAHVEMAERDAARLLDCYRRTDVLPLGSGALAGVPYPLDRDYTARLLGFSGVSRNSMDAVSDRDFVVEQLAALALVAAHLSRLAEDLILWSSDEFGFLQIGDAHSTGSSIMPQKRNPDVAELVRGKAGRVFGHLVAILTLLKGLPLTYNKDLQEDKEALFDAVDTVLGATAITGEMLQSVSVRAERMGEAAAANFSTATDYADYLTRKGLPFREAHALVGELVRTCEARSIELAQLTLNELRSVSPLFDADAVAISAERSVQLRVAPGGTAPARVAEALASARDRFEP